MFFNYLKSAIRNLRKYKLYAFINVIGLSIAVALGILIYLYISDELTYDNFHTRKDSIYRLEAKHYVYDSNPYRFPLDKDHSFRYAWMPTPFGPTIQEEIPDIVEFSRYSDDDVIISTGDEAFNEKVVFVDPGFLRMFDFELLEGNINSALNDIHNLVITRAIAKKYFGDEDPMGKTLSLDIWDVRTDCMVSGIIEDPPGNSSFNFRILVRQELRPFFKESVDNWNSFSSPTFIELAPNTNMEQFRGRLNQFTDKYFSGTIKDVRERQNLSETVKVFELAISPLEKIHLDTKVSWYQVSDITYSYILGGIGMLIFLIACLNYILLSISSSAGRSTEIGIRKVLGAERASIACHFWGESQVLCIISVLLGVFFAYLLLNPFNTYSGKTLSLFNTGNLLFCCFLLVMPFITGILAGGYPALFLSKFQPVEVLKKKSSGKFNLSFTRWLVVLQYALSGILITCSLIMFRQMRYVTTQDLGYSKEQVLVIPTFTGWTDDGERLINNLKNELKGVPGIVTVAGTNYSFNRGGWSKNRFEISGKQHAAFIYRVDPDYLNTMGIQIVSGRDFRSQNPYDKIHGIIVNEAMVMDFGWENPIGERLYWRKDSIANEIIGVTKDYNFLSFTEKVEPVILTMNPAVSKIWMAMIKISPENMPGTIDRIEKIWKSLNPGKPFDYSFLDEDVTAQYTSYQRWMKIMGWSTGLAIFVACLGLFGLAGISAGNRTKDISIRKVFGASITNLFILMNREIVLLTLLSFLIATPFSWYFMNRWLDTFAYHIGIPWVDFIIAALSGVVVAVGTVSYHSIRITLINPARILRDE